MEQNLQNRVIIAINTYFPELINDYLEDNKNSIDAAIKIKEKPKALLDLIITLKHWANPFGDYSIKLPPTELINLKDIPDVLATPRKILSQEKGITPSDENEIAELVRIKLDKIADELIHKYDLKSEIEEELATNKSSVENWWKNKTQDERLRIKQDYANLSKVEKNRLEKRVNKYPINSVDNSDPLICHYYWMCHCRSDLYFYNWITMLQVADLFARLHPGTMRTDNGCGGISNSGSRSDDIQALGIVGSIGIGLALISAGAIGGIYAAKKTFNSVVNFFTGNKMLRSAFRLTGIGVGGYLGATGGTIVGATLGSMIPGIGNVAGAILGTIFGAGLCAGVGALITKYTAKGISALCHFNEINPTNPEKYKLTKHQITNLTNKGLDLNVVDKMIKAIKREKDKIGISGSFPWTESRKKKNDLNRLLHQIKKGQILGLTKIGLLYYDPSLNHYKSPSQSSTAKYIFPAIHNEVTPPSSTNVKIKPSAPPLQELEQPSVNLESSKTVEYPDLFNNSERFVYR